jgi:hypothetical protein
MIETIRFDGRTISEVRKKFRQWYEDNRGKISIVNEHDIERLQPTRYRVSANISSRATATKTSIRCWSNTSRERTSALPRRRDRQSAPFCSLRPLWRAALIATGSQKSILDFGIDAMQPLLRALCLLLVCSNFSLKLGNPIFGRA